MNNPVELVPVARPVCTPVARTIHPLGQPISTTQQPASVPLDQGSVVLVPGGTDRMAVFSAVCGLTGLIPFITQVAGLCLGFASLSRIRQARRRGVQLGGKGWAITGIVTSVVGLLGWIGMGMAMTLLTSSLGNSTDSLNSVLETMRALD